MASIVSAGTTSATALNMSADTTGILQLASNNGTVALTITAAQNVGIGTSSPINNGGYGGLSLNGTSGFLLSMLTNGTESSRIASIGDQTSIQCKATNGYITFVQGVSGGTERVRIDPAGSLLIGESTNSSANGKLSIFQSSTSTVESMRITSAASSYTQLLINTTNALFDDTHYGATSTRTASGSFNFYTCSAGGVAQFRVAGNGIIYAQNTSVQSISDVRTKENIVNATDGLAVITALRPVRFDFKEGFGNDLKNQLGFIAQEMEAVFPDAVSEWKLNKEDETIYKTVGPAALIPVLVKAIQELSAKVTALENK